jgi:hypothetical protein
MMCLGLLTSCSSDRETNPINARYLDEQRSSEWVEQHIGAVIGASVGELTLYPVLSVFPNPFNPHTTISFAVPDSQYVWLWIAQVVDLSEYQIDDWSHSGAVLNVPDGAPVIVFMAGYKTVGSHQVVWDGTDLFGNRVPSGIYRIFWVAGPYYDFMDMMAVWEPSTLIDGL